MASEKTTAILDAIKELTILELADLVKEIEAEFGVSAAVSVSAGPAAADTELYRRSECFLTHALHDLRYKYPCKTGESVLKFKAQIYSLFKSFGLSRLLGLGSDTFCKHVPQERYRKDMGNLMQPAGI